MKKINLKKDLTLKKKKEIIEEFELNGLVKFTILNKNMEDLTNFIDNFSISYSNDALRRNTRFNNSKIKDVDIGLNEIKLHSETSFSPAQPEIIWFYCINPPEDNSGSTTLCDGLKLWNNLSAATKSFFLESQVKYKLKIPIDIKKKRKGKKKWYLDAPGVSNCFLNYDKNIIEFDYFKYAIQKSRYPNKLCFANHLLVSINSEPQLLERTIAGKNKLPKDINLDIILKSKKLTQKIMWNKNELIMIDNYRFMHGREKIINSNRDIVVIQTKTASFGYGEYIRGLKN
jgi:hypothetical protein